MVLSTFLQSMAANESHRPRQDAGKGPWLWHLLFIGFPQGLPTRSKAFPQVAEKLWGVSQDSGLNGQQIFTQAWWWRKRLHTKYHAMV
jgi:hypothetical protein